MRMLRYALLGEIIDFSHLLTVTASMRRPLCIKGNSAFFIEIISIEENGHLVSVYNLLNYRETCRIPHVPGAAASASARPTDERRVCRTEPVRGMSWSNRGKLQPYRNGAFVRHGPPGQRLR